MTTELLEMEQVSQESNGDRYYLRPFNAKESYEHVHLFESKRLEAKVRCGLELWRAKLNLWTKEGHGAWYPYLFKCGMSQPTASRRKQVAVDFLVWAGIIQPGKEPTEQQVISGLELVYSKPFILNGFRESRINWEEVRKSLKEAAGSVVSTEPNLGLKAVILGIRKISEQAIYDTKARDALETIYLTTSSLWEGLIKEESMREASKNGDFERAIQTSYFKEINAIQTS